MAFDFGTEFQNVFKAMEVELGIFGEAAGVRDADVVVFGGDFWREMVLSGEQIDDLLFVCGIKEPSLGFNAGGEECN